MNRLVTAQQALREGVPFWGRNLLDEPAGGRDPRGALDEAKTFLESLQAFSTPGRLKNFRYETHDVERHRAGLDAVREVESLRELAAAFGGAAAYLSAAEAMLPSGAAWTARMKDARTAVLDQVADPAARSRSGFRSATQRTLAKLKAQYVRAYLDLHARARLGVDDDARKRRLLNGDRLQQASALATIDLLPRQRLTDFQNRLAGVRTCFGLTEQDLAAAAECPHCGFRPATEPLQAPAGNVLSALGDELDAILADWTAALLANLDDPTIKDQLALLDSDQRMFVTAFVDSRTLPDNVDGAFVHAVRTLLSGLAKVAITTHDLRVALLSGGSPSTIDEMTARFEDFLSDRAKGNDLAKVRIVLE